MSNPYKHGYQPKENDGVSGPNNPPTPGSFDDLPATNAQIKANPKVQALVELLREYREKTPLGHQPHMIAHRVDAALAALEADT